MVAVVYAFQDLLNTVRGVGLAVEFPGDDVLKQFSAGDSVSVLRFNSISQMRARSLRGSRVKGILRMQRERERGHLIPGNKSSMYFHSV